MPYARPGRGNGERRGYAGPFIIPLLIVPSLIIPLSHSPLYRYYTAHHSLLHRSLSHYLIHHYYITHFSLLITHYYTIHYIRRLSMALINAVNEVLHRIKVKLYPNYLTHVKGAYIARADNEATLGVEDICAALKNRGGFTGNYDDLVEYVKQFFDEMIYQLCDGFAVNLKYFLIYPNVGGAFDVVVEGRGVREHPVTFHFRILSPLRALAERIAVDVEGLADVQGYIDVFTDITTDSVNEALTPGGMFSIAGHKLKIAGDDPEVGVYFVPEAGPAGRVKAGGRLAENTPAKLIGIVPALGAGKWRVEVKTQFSGSGSNTLKAPRTIASAFTLTVPAPAP
jgi:hypothetical protein